MCVCVSADDIGKLPLTPAKLIHFVKCNQEGFQLITSREAEAPCKKEEGEISHEACKHVAVANPQHATSLDHPSKCQHDHNLSLKALVGKRKG